MRLSILVWDGGENNPFEYFANAMKDNYESHDCIVDLHKLPTLNQTKDIVFFVKSLLRAKPDVVLTFQGLGSRIQLSDQYQNIWEQFKIKLVCIHGDHPAMMVANHTVDSEWVQHLYTVASYKDFANLYLPLKKSSRECIYFAGTAKDTSLTQKTISGDYFVIPKNLDDTLVLKRALQKASSPLIWKMMEEVFSVVDSELQESGFSEHHRVLDEIFFSCEQRAALYKGNETSTQKLFWDLHFFVDKYYRNKVSEILVSRLQDFPLHINGRGWDRFKNLQCPKHTFNEAPSLSNGHNQFLSTYGIIDVSPVPDSLHDRTERAIYFGSSFLSVSNWCANNQEFLPFSDLFVGVIETDIIQKFEKVLSSPQHHRERSLEFAKCYKERFTTEAFLSEVKQYLN